VADKGRNETKAERDKRMAKLEQTLQSERDAAAREAMERQAADDKADRDRRMAAGARNADEAVRNAKRGGK